MWFIGVEVEQETSAAPPKKNSWIRPWVCTVSVTDNEIGRLGAHSLLFKNQ